MLPLSYLYFTFHTPFSHLLVPFQVPFIHLSVTGQFPLSHFSYILVTFQLPFIHLSVTFESPFSYLSFTDQLPFSFFSADSQNGTVSSCIVTRYIALKPLCNHYMNLKTIIQGVCSILPPPPKFSYQNYGKGCSICQKRIIKILSPNNRILNSPENVAHLDFIISILSYSGNHTLQYWKAQARTVFECCKNRM